MLSSSWTIVPRADRYGHPGKIDVTTSEWKSHKLDIAAPHCDKYGHIDSTDPKGQPLTYDLWLFSAKISRVQSAREIPPL